MLTITTPASDPTLLTLAEIAEAVGGSVSQGATLHRLNARVSELIAGACNLQRAGSSVLTLRAETLTETVRLRCPVGVLYLSRKPVIEVLAVTEGEDALVADDDYEMADERSLQRLSSGESSWWATGKVIVSYRAGYATVPPGLKEMAAKLAVILNSERGRDPSSGGFEIPGVYSETSRYGRPDDPLISAEIMEGLKNGGFVHSQTMIG